jgi:ATP-dependent DNA ligase
VRYVLFDLLYHAGRCLLREPLLRREVLAETCQRLDAADVRFSEGVVGKGKALYAAALAQGHEGVMAMHLGPNASFFGHIRHTLDRQCQRCCAQVHRP